MRKIHFTLFFLFSLTNLVAQPLSSVWPKQNQVLYNAGVEFAWNVKPGTVAYTLTLSMQADLSAPVLTISQPGNLHNFTLPQAGTYFWQVEAVDGQTQTTRSPIYTFALFTPRDIPGLMLWLDAAGVIADAQNRVSQWTDKSGMGHHVVQSLNTAMPIHQNNVLNGNPGLVFNGTTQFLDGGNILNLGLNSQAVFVVGRALKTNSTFLAKSLAGTAINRYGLFWESGRLNYLYHDNTNRPLAITRPFGNFELITALTSRSRSRNELFSHGVKLGEAAINPGHNLTSVFNFLVGAYNSTVGGIPPFSGYFHQGEIAEILMYRHDFSQAQRLLVERYLRSKYFPGQFQNEVNLGFDKYLASFCPFTLDAGAGYSSYLWNTGATTQTIIANTPGAYSVTVTDIFGHQSTDQVVVSFLYTSLNNKQPLICPGGNREIFPMVPYPELYTYLWNTGATSHTLEVSEAGSYWVQITNNQGCVALSDTLHLALDDFAARFTLGANLQFCAGNTLQVPGETTGIVSWLWNTGATTPQIPITQTGNYSLTVTNTNGCQARDTVFVEITGTAPTVGFAFNTPCLGEATLFTDLSTAAGGDELAQWQWFLGDTLFATQQNPVRVFPSPGSYPITLVVRAQSGCSSTITQTARVLPVPTADFTTEMACIRQPYAFTDRSTSHGENPITEWHWDFGDGNVSHAQNPNHVYSQPGAYTVVLTVTASNGCQDTTSRQLEVVGRFDLPREFTLVQPKANGFYIPGQVPFLSNASTNANTYSLVIATDANFQHIVWDGAFNPTQGEMVNLGPGTYYTRVAAANICQDIAYSMPVRFRVFAPGLIDQLSLWVRGSDVELQGSRVQAWSDLSEKGNHLLQNTQASQPQWIPNIINGHPVLRFNGTSQFLDGGDILDLGDKSRTIFVVAQDNGTGRHFAKSRFATAQSRYGLLRAGNTLTWLFHDNTEKNISVTLPGSTFNIITQKTNRQIAQNQLFFDSRLIGSNSITAGYNMQSDFNFLVGAYNSSLGFLPPSSFHNGDIAEIIFVDKALSTQEQLEVESYLRLKYFPSQYVQQVDLGFDRNIAYGFCPVTLDAGAGYSSYLWNTGATTQSIVVYTSGTYSVTVTDNFGFQSTDEVNVNFPAAGLNVTNAIVCEGESIQLEFVSAFTPLVDILWSTGETAPVIEVSQAGIYKVTLTDSLGCTLELSAHVVVDLFGSTATLGPDRPFCMGDELGLITEGKGFGMENTTSLPRTYLWSTGAATPTIVISEPGHYSLITTNENGCVANPSVSLSLQGNTPVAGFEAGPVCLGEATLFTDLSTVEGSEIISRQWYFGDEMGGQASGSHVSHTYTQSGIFPVVLEVESAAGCRKSITQLVQVYQLPQGWFTPNNACTGIPVRFSDASTDMEGGIMHWEWEFRNPDGSLAGTSRQQSPQHNFETPGNARARLIVASQVGCRDTVERIITVRESPKIDFNFTSPCLGVPVFFTDLTTAPPWARVVSQQWSFGDGNTSGQSNPSHLYQRSGIFDVTLSVTAINGCRPTLTRQVTVHSPPVADFLNPDICAGTPHTFHSTSTVENSTIASWQWDFGALGQAGGQSPQKTFTQPGQYNVGLTVTSEAGCQGSIMKMMEVHPVPTPGFTIFPRFGTAPLTVTFTNQSQGASHYQWSFGDGSLLSTQPNPIHTFTLNGVYTTTLTAITNQGCTTTLEREIRVIPINIGVAITNVGYGVRNNYLEVTANLMNQGNLEFDSLYLNFHLSGQRPLREIWTGRLDPGRTTAYTFKAQLPWDNRFDYFCVEVSIPGLHSDNNSGNDRMCRSFHDEFRLLPPYPSPAIDMVNIGFIIPWPGEVEIIFTDTHGRLLDGSFRSTFPEGITFQQFDIPHLNRGIYFYRITFSGESRTGRFVVY